MQDFIAALSTAQEQEVEITTQMKNADIALIPTPYAGSDAAGTSIVMLDPMSTEPLRDLVKAGESVAEILHKKYIRVKAVVNRAAPPGVTVLGWDWKNTVS